MREGIAIESDALQASLDEVADELRTSIERFVQKKCPLDADTTKQSAYLTWAYAAAEVPQHSI